MSSIAENAERLIEAVEDRYPAADVGAWSGPSRGAPTPAADAGRRWTRLLGAVAKEYGLSFVSVGDWLTRYGLRRAPG